MWNEDRYNKVRKQCQEDIDNKIKTPYEYMIQYETMIKIEDYEAAKAITEVLAPLNYKTIDCHNRIGLNK